MWVQFLECLPPKCWEGKKTSKFRRYIWQFSTLIANISRTDRYSANRKNSWSTTTAPTFGEKSLWTLVHKRKSYSGAHWSTEVDIFRDPGYLSYTPTPTGRSSPPKKLNCENLKFALKFSVCAYITSGLVGVSSWNFSRRRAARHRC